MAKYKSLIKQYFQALSDGNFEFCVNAYRDDAIVHITGSAPGAGEYPIAIFKEVMPHIKQAFPEGLRFTLGDLTEEDDRIAVQATSSAVHASGVPYNNEYHYLVYFDEHNKIRKMVEYADTALVASVADNFLGDDNQN